MIVLYVVPDKILPVTAEVIIPGFFQAETKNHPFGIVPP
jgi:hypothetical protein